MRKFLIWTAIVIGSLLGLILLSLGGLSVSANNRLNKTYSIQPEPVSIPTDAESIEEGRRLASIYCAGCHGADMAGTDFFNDSADRA